MSCSAAGAPDAPACCPALSRALARVRELEADRARLTADVWRLQDGMARYMPRTDIVDVCLLAGFTEVAPAVAYLCRETFRTLPDGCVRSADAARVRAGHSVWRLLVDARVNQVRLYARPPRGYDSVESPTHPRNWEAFQRREKPSLLGKGSLGAKAWKLLRADFEASLVESGTRLLVFARQGARWRVRHIRAWHADARARDARGRTALHFAAMRGHAAVVRDLLAADCDSGGAGADADAADDGGETSLIAASRWGHLAVVRALLAHGAGANAADSNGRTSLRHAAERGHVRVVRALLRAGADVDALAADGRTSLIAASSAGHADIVRALAASGAAVDAADGSGITSLAIAVCSPPLFDNLGTAVPDRALVARKLVARGANVNALVGGPGGDEPLLVRACIAGNLDGARVLLGGGVDIEARDARGWSSVMRLCEYEGPLAAAAAFDSSEQKGRYEPFTISSHSYDGVAAKEMYSVSGKLAFEGVIAAQARLDLLRELLARGANVEAADNFGWTSLVVASDKGLLEVVRELVARGANLEAATKSGCTSLYKAIYEGQLEVVRELLARGASVESGASSVDGVLSPPLCVAAYLGFVEVCRALLAAGARCKPSYATLASASESAPPGSREEILALMQPVLEAAAAAARDASAPVGSDGGGEPS